MRRRRFLKAVLGAGVALMVPWSPAALKPITGGNTVTTLDGIFKRVYAGKIRNDLIPRQIKIIEDNQRLLSEPVFFQPITLKHENGFTK